MLSLAIFPLFWSSFSETSGRRPVYIVSFTLLIIFNILSALSTNIAMFILMRILSGGASGSVQVVGAGTLADVWHVRERGKAMGYFYLGPLLGPLIAPLIGGALQLKWGWRAALWFLVLYSVVTWLLLLWILPETLKSTKPIISEEEQQAVAATPANTPLSRTSTGRSVAVGGRRFVKILRRVFVDPFLIIYYLRFPAVAITVYYASITFGSLYVLQVSIQAEFGKAPYNFSSLEVGLAYVGLEIHQEIHPKKSV